MRIGRTTTPLALTDSERKTLRNWERRGGKASTLARRARMILRCADGGTNTEVAEDLGVSKATIGKWRSRFLKQRLGGLADNPRTGRPRTITDADIARVVTLTLQTSSGEGAQHWSTRSMAKRSGFSRTTVSRIWRTFALQPHRSQAIKPVADPTLARKPQGIEGPLLEHGARVQAIRVYERQRGH